MKKTIIILLLVIIVAGISGGTVYFVMNKGNEDKSVSTQNMEEDKLKEENTTKNTDTNTTKDYKYIFSTNGNAILERTTSLSLVAEYQIRCQYCGSITDSSYKRCYFSTSKEFPQTKQVSDFCYNCSRGTTTAEITCQRIEK